MNKVILIGNLTRDPETKTLTSGQTVTTCGLATNKRWTDKQSGEKKEQVTFHNLVIWGKGGETFAHYTSKGKKVMVEGEIQHREYEGKDGVKRQTSEINVRYYEFLSPKSEGGEMGAVKERMKSVPKPAEPAEEGDEVRVEDIPF